MTPRKPTPICFDCGSADVEALTKTASCNRCGIAGPIEKFTAHAIRPEGQGHHLLDQRGRPRPSAWKPPQN